MHQILYELKEGGIISDVKIPNCEELAYQPARDLNSLSVKFVLEALERRGVDSLPVTGSAEFDALSATMESFSAIIEKSPENKLLKDL